MGYKVKWVEDNIGVSRKALRIFEKMGLMPANKGGQYRDYDETDIERIWAIRVLQGMGYSLKEIADMATNVGFDFETSISEKVEQLEQEKIKIERHLGYAKTIKFTGRFPTRPKQMGTVRFDDFYEKSLSEWNLSNDPQTEQYCAIADMILTKPQEEWENKDLGRLLDFFGSLDLSDTNMEAILNEHILIKALVKRISLGSTHPEVQLIVKLIFENQKELSSAFEEMTPKQFARLYSSSYLSGDIARLRENNYGKAGCEFAADAVAIFGGYSGYNDPQLQ